MKRITILAAILALALSVSCASPGATQDAPEETAATTEAAQAPTPAGVDAGDGVATGEALTTAAMAADAAPASPAAVATEPAVDEGAAREETASEDAAQDSDTEKKAQEKEKKKADAGKEKKKTSSGSEKSKEEKKEEAKEEKPKAETITVSVSIDCKTLAASDPDMAALVSQDGVLLGKKDVSVKKDATVYDVLAASGASFSGTEYISKIGGLSEFDAGPESGGVFLVRGVYAGGGGTTYPVKDGDYVQFRYTLNTGADVQKRDGSLIRGATGRLHSAEWCIL
jgi:hypothetical protein